MDIMKDLLQEKIKKYSNQDKMLSLYIVVASILVVGILYIVDQRFLVSYNTKIIIKLILFSVVPFVYIKLSKDNFVKKSFKNHTPALKMDISKALGIFVVIVLIIGFIIFRNLFDVNTIVYDFRNKYQIVGNQILYYGLYLSFVNSLLEELFFRGFIFLGLKHINCTKFGYIFSSFMFSIYHIANFKNWFNPLVFILCLVGLFIGGLIFAALDDKKDTFFNSWFVHICADLAIVAIGYYVINISAGL